MNAEADVLAAALRRAEALGRGDRVELESLLHPQFVWTSHTGESFELRTYLDANIDGQTAWHGQQIYRCEYSGRRPGRRLALHRDR